MFRVNNTNTRKRIESFEYILHYSNANIAYFQQLNVCSVIAWNQTQNEKGGGFDMGWRYYVWKKTSP